MIETMCCFKIFKTSFFKKKLFYIGAPCSGKDYELKEKIGTGSFSRVYKAVYKPTGKYVAIKITNKDRRNLDDIRREAVVLQRMGRHEHIVKFYAYFEDEKNSYMILEYVNGCDLHEYIISLDEPINEEICIKWIIQIASAVAHAQSCGVTSRDIKPSNILITNEGVVKLADFGLAFICNDINTCKINTSAGSQSFSAPEVFDAEKNPYLAGPADVWSLGIVFYCMLTGYHPFDSKRYCEHFIDAKGLSIKTQEFLKSIFQLDPLSRPKLEAFYSLI